MKLNELVKEAHLKARKKGWWENPKSPLECHMLIVSEISEATEEVRKNNPPIYQESDIGKIELSDEIWDADKKPEGELIELADAVIRIADYCGFKGWDLEKAIKVKMDFNEKRSYRHGNKKY